MVVSLLLIIMGLASFYKLPVREYPDIDPPIVTITTVYIGASAQVVEREVTQLVESSISGVAGIKRITSNSREEISQVTVEFVLGTDIDTAANDLRDKVARISSALPDTIELPNIAKAEADSNAVFWMGIWSDVYNGLEITDYIVRNLQDRFSVVPGVASILIGGAQYYAMRVWLDREALAARELTIDDVMQAIERENVELPAGRIESEQREFSVRMYTRLQTPEEFEKIVIQNNNGALVRLKDIAQIEMSQDTRRKVMFFNGKPVVGMGVIRQSKANTIAVAEAMRKEFELVQASLPEGMESKVMFDASLYIRDSINEVLTALGVAMLLVTLVIYGFFTSVRAAFIPVVAIPVSIISSVSVLAALGYSINILTLLALVLAIGLVVDDAIVVLENIQRRIERGESPRQASFAGAKQIAFAVIATTAVLVAVFIPLSFMEGNVGRLFTEFGIALAAAVIFSSFVALTLTPMMCSRILQQSSATPETQVDSRHWFARLNTWYYRLLLHVQKQGVLVVLVALLISLVAGGFYALVPKEIAPTEDRSVVFIPFDAPEGSSLEFTNRQAQKIAALIEPLRESGEAESYLYILAPGFDGPGAVSNGFGIAGLAPIEERARSQRDIVNDVFPKLLSIPGVRAFAINPASLGQRGFGADLQIVVGATTYAEANEWADNLMQAMLDNPQLINIDKDYKETKPEIGVEVFRDKAADVGVDTGTIARTLEALFGSKTVSTFIDRNESYDVIVQVDDKQRLTPNDLSLVHVRSASSELIPLSNLIELSETAVPKELKRVNRLPAITISASLQPGYALGNAIDYIGQTAQQVLPAAARLDYSGQSRAYVEGNSTAWLTFAIAILIVFLVLAAQFESWIYPLIIILTVPIAITGGLATLWLTGGSLNVFSQIGLLLLVGLIAKNGILIVEFANQLRAEGLAVAEAALEAARQRFRPVLMTTIATMFGAIPLLIAVGAGAESRRALAVVIFGGIGFATLITLFLIPVLYRFLAGYTAVTDAGNDAVLAANLAKENQR